MCGISPSTACNIFGTTPYYAGVNGTAEGTVMPHMHWTTAGKAFNTPLRGFFFFLSQQCLIEVLHSRASSQESQEITCFS